MKDSFKMLIFLALVCVILYRPIPAAVTPPYIESEDPVILKNDPIIVNSTVILTSSFDGGGRTYLRGPLLGDKPLFELLGEGNTLSNLIVDDGNYRGVSGALFVKGVNNSIKYITLNNCVRYGICSSNATNFYIGHNIVTKAQYCISGSQADISEGGIIEHNQLSGMILYGIKMKSMNNVTVRYNYIDVAPINPGWDDEPAEYSKRGITTTDFDKGIHPVIDCVIEYNIIVQSIPFQPNSSMTSTGFYASQDIENTTTGNIIRYNTIVDCVSGVWLIGNNYHVYGNHLINCISEYRDEGTNNQM